MFYRKSKAIHSNTLPGNLSSCRQGHFYLVKATAPLSFSPVLKGLSFSYRAVYSLCTFSFSGSLSETVSFFHFILSSYPPGFCPLFGCRIPLTFWISDAAFQYTKSRHKVLQKWYPKAAKTTLLILRHTQTYTD